MIIDYKELVLELFVHKGGFALGNLQEIFKSRFGYDLVKKQLSMKMFISF